MITSLVGASSLCVGHNTRSSTTFVITYIPSYKSVVLLLATKKYYVNYIYRRMCNKNLRVNCYGYKYKRKLDYVRTFINLIFQL